MSTDAKAPSEQHTLTDLEAELAKLETPEDVEAFVDGDERAGAHKLAAARVAELLPPAPPAAVDTAALVEGIARLTSEPDARTKASGPLADNGGPAVVRTPWPVDLFEHEIKGVPPITAHGVEVDGKHRKQLNELAETVGIRLQEVEAD